MKKPKILPVLGLILIAGVTSPSYGMQFALDKSYAARYVVHNLIKNWWLKPSYTQEQPINIPKQLPSPEEIAQQIAERIKPRQFMRGASTSAHQCGKLCDPEHCSWSRFAAQHNMPQPTDNCYRMDWDKHYKAYIDYAKDTLKLNALRFSIEWSLVQPSENEWNVSTLDRYADMFCYAIKRGVTPVVCFHHYTDPNWFLDQGGFESQDNIEHFVNFCTKTYGHIIQKAQQDGGVVQALTKINEPLWATYNAPAGYAFRGYRQQGGPPADPNRSGLDVVAEVLKNMLEAHVRVYQGMKQAHKILNIAQHVPAPKIGFLKNIHQIDPAKETWSHYAASPITRMMVSFADMIQNGAIYNFFTNGVYQVHIPFKINMKHINNDAPRSLDFIGLNYYANRRMCFTQGIKPADPELCSDNEWYYRYPQGIYRAIVELSDNLARPLNIPMFVAENGIATQDNAKRARFYHEYLYAMNRAIQDGYLINGYLPWTLADNYEWPSIQDNKKRSYGLCAVSQNNPTQLIEKEGTKASYGAFTREMERLERAKY